MKKFLSLFVFIILSQFAFAQTLPAQNSEDTEETQVENLADFASYQEPLVKEVSFAKPFDLTINLDKPAQLEMPEESDFEIINLQQQDPAKIVLTLVPFNLGISTFTATLIDEEGQSFALPDLPLEIKKVKTKYDGQALLDIRGPQLSFGILFYIILILLILAAIVYFIYWYQKRKKKALALKISNPYADETKTPEEIALAQIDNLLLQDLWENKQYKLFYILLTDILRDYLTARFKFDAHNFTTKDLMRYLKSRSDFNYDLMNPLEIFLKSSDFVKFAKAIPTEAQRTRNVGDLRFVIQKNALPKPETKEEETRKGEGEK